MPWTFDEDDLRHAQEELLLPVSALTIKDDTIYATLPAHAFNNVKIVGEMTLAGRPVVLVNGESGTHRDHLRP